MELENLVEIVETMIVQHDYPGFEARALNLGLPHAALEAPAKVFGEALKHQNIFVQLAALRWFQARPGLIKSYLNGVVNLLHSNDEYVRMEATKTLERSGTTKPEAINKVSVLLKDQNDMVRKAAAKALGKLLSKEPSADEAIIAALREAANDPDEQVRWKAQKALRRLGAYAG